MPLNQGFIQACFIFFWGGVPPPKSESSPPEFDQVKKIQLFDLKYLKKICGILYMKIASMFDSIT